MLRWWKASEKRVVLAVRPVDERTVQIIRKGPFWSSALSSWMERPSKRSMRGLRGCRPLVGPPTKQSSRWQRRNLRLGLKLAARRWLLQRGRPSREAVDEASVEESYGRAIGNAPLAATARLSRARRPRNCQNQAGTARRAVRRYAKE